MTATSRIVLARQAYEAAVRAARASSTPRTWARLLRAARNLREAKDDARRVEMRREARRTHE